MFTFYYRDIRRQLIQLNSGTLVLGSLSRLSPIKSDTLARSLHDVSCANDNHFAVVVCFNIALRASEMQLDLSEPS